jgi:Domain of unknown function (DUF4157)
MRSYEEFSDAERGHKAATPSNRREDAAVPAPLVASRLAAPNAVLGLQRVAGNAAVARLINPEQSDDQQRSPVLDVVGRGDGEPLMPAVRGRMEKALGADFADVRVHVGPKAAASAEAVQARAYTVGNEIVFARGSYEPGTQGGERMLAHELTHVIQQRSGPVEGTPVAGGIALSDPNDRFERAAEADADRVTASAPAVQRQEDEGEEMEEEPTAQGLFVQRQDDTGDETDEFEEFEEFEDFEEEQAEG